MTAGKEVRETQYLLSQEGNSKFAPLTAMGNRNDESSLGTGFSSAPHPVARFKL